MSIEDDILASIEAMEAEGFEITAPDQCKIKGCMRRFTAHDLCPTHLSRLPRNKERQAAWARKRWSENSEYRARARERNRNSWHTDAERRERHKAWQKHKYNTDDEYRNKVNKRNSDRQKTPEGRATSNARHLERMATDSKYRAKKLESARKYQESQKLKRRNSTPTLLSRVRSSVFTQQQRKQQIRNRRSYLRKKIAKLEADGTPGYLIAPYRIELAELENPT